MYAHKFQPQNLEIAAQFMDNFHDYCSKEKEKEKYSESDDEIFESVQFKKKYSRVIVYSDSESDCEPLQSAHEYFDVSGVEHTVEVCSNEILPAESAVRVQSVDSGVFADEYIRSANTTIAFEYMPGLRASSKLLYSKFQKMNANFMSKIRHPP